MTDLSDHELLAQYARNKSDAAFAALAGRYVNLVYSAGLRFTGNPHDAQDITQAVFIILASKASSLSRGTVLSGWFYQTARLTASNFVRGEIRRQRREQEAYMQNTGTESDSLAWEQIGPVLDEAMGRLGETDRNAIVLRFFENKTSREVAAALNLKEAAAHKRVSRALEKLRALLVSRGVTVTTPVIAGAVSANAIQAAPAGLAATVSATAAKSISTAVGFGAASKLFSLAWKPLLLSWAAPLLSLIGSLPALAIGSAVSAAERKNFRDTQGFRPELHRRGARNFFLSFPLVVMAGAIIQQLAMTIFGISGVLRLVVGFMGAMTLLAGRSLTIARNPFQFSQFFFCLILMVGFSALSLGWIPQSLAQLPMLAAFTLLLLTFSQRPAPRMDYSLFLRAAGGQFDGGERTADVLPSQKPIDRKSLLRFARFLGSRLLIRNFAWKRRGLALRLQSVESRFLQDLASTLMPPVSQECSHLLLGWDGTVGVHCGKTDAEDLAALNAGQPLDLPQLECRVSDAVVQASRDFKEGRIAAAERAVGQISESGIFLVPPARASGTRGWRMLLGAAMLATLLGIMLQFWRPGWMSGLKPVDATEAQVRAFLSDTAADSDPKGTRRNDASVPLLTCLVLPPTDLFSAGELRSMRDEVAGGGGFTLLRTQPARMGWIFGGPLARRAVADGWITLDDLQIQPADLEAFLRVSRPRIIVLQQWDQFLMRRESWSWVTKEKFEVMRMGLDGLAQLRILCAVNCLGLADSDKLIRQIASVQVLSEVPPGHPPIHDWHDVRGLFFTPSWPALQDTYYSLAALEILGGMNQIDREACIQGILRRHQGNGYFTSPNSGGFNEYRIDGSARDTIAAFESLRILGALDRVKDLDKWEFRVGSNRSSSTAASGGLTWDEVEAWVCQQRLRNIVRTRNENPSKPFRSLLEINGI